MSRALRLGALFALSARLLLAAETTAEPTPLRSLLAELARAGVEIVWSEALVPAEAAARLPDPALPVGDRLEAMLAPHGLAAVRSRAGGWLVVVRTAPEARGALVVVVRSVAGAPVAGAEVRVDGRRAETGPEGVARFADLAPGEVRVEVRRPGYVIEEGLTARIPPAGEAALDVRLAPVVDSGAEIVVTPSRFTLFGEPAPPALGRDREELARTPHLGDDPLRVAGRMPGTASGDFSSPFAVRGGEPREVAIRIDGLELERPFHLPDLQALFSAVDSALVGEMELHTGGYPVELGGRLSGVLDVTTRAATARGPLELGIGLLAARVLAGGATAGGTRWLASARRGYLDLIVPRVDTGGELEPTYADLFGKIDWPIGDGARLALETLATDDRERFTGEVEGDERLEGTADSLALWGRFDSALGGRGYGRALVAATRRTRGARGYVEFGDSTSDDRREAEEAALALDAEFSLGERHALRVGLGAARARATYRHDSLRVIDDPILIASGLPPRTERHAHLDPSGERLSAYAADRLRFGERTVVELGLRYERWSWADDERATPRLHLVFAASPALDLRLSWGTFAQARAIDELAVEDGLDQFPRAEIAEHRILGLDARAGGLSRFRLELFEKLYRDLAPRYENLFDPIQLFPALESDRVLVDADEGRARGVEISWLRRGGRRADVDLAYSWSRAEDRVEERWQRRRLDQEHAVTAGLTLRLGERWTVSLAGLFHSGWPTTEARLELVDGPEGEPVLVSRLGERNAERYPDYFRMDLRVARRFETRRGELVVALDLYNLTSRDNVCCVKEFLLVPGDGPVPGLDPGYDTWLPLVPSFGITWRRR